MILRKLKEIRSKIFKPARPTRPPTQRLAESMLATQEHEDSVDTQPLPGIKYLQRRQMAAQKQYFDSADHFLRLYNEEQSIIKPSCHKLPEDTQAESTKLAADDPEKPLQAAPAPLETAYSEIIDEMKPKESV